MHAMILTVPLHRLQIVISIDYGRVAKQKKLFMTDTGLMTSILRWNID
jgi:hypothetical protein